MARNVIENDFQSSKMAEIWLPAAILKKKKMLHIKSYFRSSKMAAGGHFVKQIPKNKRCVLIWNGEKCNQKWFSVIQYDRQ